MPNKMNAEVMAEYLYGFPQQFAYCLQMDIEVPADYYREYRHIVISGMGGSAIGGDILRGLLFAKSKIPVIVNRGYELPAYINEETLFIAVSYSGNTEETLQAYQSARNQGAQVVIISSGGKLSQWAVTDKVPLIKIPGDLVPRAASAYLFTPLALLMEKLGLAQNLKEEITETIQVLEQMRTELTGNQCDNPARRLAAEIKEHIPLVWGANGPSEIAAQRWKGQLNENAKTLAFYNIFPELNHNEIVGFEVPEAILKQMIVILLKDKGDNERIQKRRAITGQVIEDRVFRIREVESRGQSWLARYYSLAYWGDFVSFYLAEEYGINPTPVKIIDYLKAQLAL